MTKFISKTVEVEAVFFDGSEASFNSLVEFLGHEKGAIQYNPILVEIPNVKQIGKKRVNQIKRVFSPNWVVRKKGAGKKEVELIKDKDFKEKYQINNECKK